MRKKEAPRRRSSAIVAGRTLVRHPHRNRVVGVYFRRHEALVAVAIPHQHDLAGAELRQAKTAQRFHMHEDIFRAFAARQEAETLGAVEPLDDGAFQPAGRRHLDMGAHRRQLRGVNGGRLVHGENAERLKAAVAPLDEGDNARAFKDCLVTVATQAGDVQEHILCAIIGHDEAKTLGDIEPLYNTGDFGQVHGIARKVLDIDYRFR
ncbi:hypothetical protein AT6N2_C0451 [Agrobacterium tumefaciens]|nr:hypothetical protein AT6N2_C0451 [Agrobacterium tumefaciens]